jgi:hypothetical protein
MFNNSTKKRKKKKPNTRLPLSIIELKKPFTSTHLAKEIFSASDIYLFCKKTINIQILIFSTVNRVRINWLSLFVVMFDIKKLRKV